MIGTTLDQQTTLIDESLSTIEETSWQLAHSGRLSSCSNKYILLCKLLVKWNIGSNVLKIDGFSIRSLSTAVFKRSSNNHV